MRPISLCVASLTCTVFFALPTQAQIQAESNSTDTQISKSGNQFDISGGQLSKDGANLFHSFEKFGLSQQQVANFLSNPATRNILGRVMGGDPSVINGLIKVTGSNANLYLMNPAGMIFGPNAALDVPAAFTATTANGIGFESNWFGGSGPNDYANLVGTPTAFAFTTQEPGAITNTGNLSVNPGQNLTLMGGIVINQGELKAPGGQVNAVAVPGQNLVRLSQENHLLSLEFKPLSTAGTLPNDWTLPITSLPNLLTGGDIQNATNLSVNSKGQLVLSGSNVSVDPVAGTVIAAGKIDASNTLENQKGGSVLVLGDRVGVVDAVVDVSGDSDGGNVLIGGDFQGKGSIPTAKRTFISENSVINANAFAEGDGGEVIVWADEVTGFYGNVNAWGGNQSGDGGFVEISGKEKLDFDGLVDVSVSHGKWGTLLLDPRNIIISDKPSTVDEEDSLPEILQDDFKDSDITINAMALESQEGKVIVSAENDISINPKLSLEFLENNGSKEPDSVPVIFKAGGKFMMDQEESITAKGRNIIIRTTGDMIAGDIDSLFTSTKLGITVASSVELVSEKGDINTQTITTGAGGLNIEALNGLVRIQGTKNQNSIDGTIIESGFVSVKSFGIQNFLKYKGIKVSEKDTTQIRFDDNIPASIIVNAGIDDAPPITIRFGDSSVEHIKENYNNKSKTNQIQVLGDKDVAFSAGPESESIINNGDPFILKKKDGGFEEISPENFSCSASGCRPKDTDFFDFHIFINAKNSRSKNVPLDASGIAGSIFIIEDENSTFYGSTRGVNYTPPLPPPPEPPSKDEKQIRNLNLENKETENICKKEKSATFSMKIEVKNPLNSNQPKQKQSNSSDDCSPKSSPI
ncbi:filamentous hemagglutinin N-terminal domain-containing protein [Acaryochloris sp. IP29b_bin.148]|uniref:filamentous hemagglutinin N-terminal domain-containing protein n=1 Tax=Acaryochloris sp. IP29b_bin.148 TaxID=2969218 RepID=UPI002616AE55|nr:filamentous hemagglutinin N-terminal domain-containing protein [Acaryochloris sp. IP29b_bin.148]